MWTWRFWREALERAVKSFFQAGMLRIGGEGAAALVGLDVFNVEWMSVCGYALGGFLLSIATSIMTAKMGAPDSPSAID